MLLTESGVCKLFDYGLVFPYKDGPWNSHNYDSYSYPAPELLKKVFDNRVEVDYAKCDVFSLGMTILHAGILESNNIFYDLNTWNIDDHLLWSKTNDFTL